MTTLADIQGPRSQQVAFQIGDSFPEIVLPNAEDGSAMSLAKFRGQKVLLHIFASW